MPGAMAAPIAQRRRVVESLRRTNLTDAFE